MNRMKNMKRILSKKTGVTILEGLIALGLLALVAAGTFGVLLSVSRKSGSPDIRESMVLAVERAYDQLQMYTPELNDLSNSSVPDTLAFGLCGGDSDPLGGGTHNIDCLLPPLCDKANSSFSYTTGVTKNSMSLPFVGNYGTNGTVTGWGNTGTATVRSVEFSITCNGFTL